MFRPDLTSWRAQYDRMMRAYKRLEQPYQSSVEYDDDLQHFLQDSWHLKDWVKNDDSLTIGGHIEDEVAKHLELRIAADLANGSKHLVRDRGGREGAYVTSKNVTVHRDQSKPAEIEHTVTLKDGSKIRLAELLPKIIDRWHTVLANFGLRVS